MSKLDEFKQRWLKPLLSHKPANVEEDAFFAQILHVNSRVISAYRARRDFELVGLLCADDVPGRADLSVDKRHLAKVSRYDILWARIDDTNTTFMDVEHKGRLWQIAKSEWDKRLRGLLSLMQDNEDL